MVTSENLLILFLDIIKPYHHNPTVSSPTFIKYQSDCPMSIKKIAAIQARRYMSWKGAQASLAPRLGIRSQAWDLAANPYSARTLGKNNLKGKEIRIWHSEVS